LGLHAWDRGRVGGVMAGWVGGGGEKDVTCGVCVGQS